MKSTFRAIVSVASVMFITIYFQACSCDNSTSAVVEIESDLECIAEWQPLRLEWKRSFDSAANSSFFRNRSLFWEHLGESFKKRTESHLLLTAKYPTSPTKPYSCHGNITAYTSLANSSLSQNLSFRVQPANVGSQLIGVRFIMDDSEDRRLEIYIRPALNPTVANVRYNLAHCIIDDQGILDFNFICPQFTSVAFDCSEREQGVYGVRNSKGFICVAIVASTTGSLPSYSTLRFYIVTSRDEFRSTSQMFKITTKGSVDGPIPPVDEPGEFVKILISRRPRYLTVEPKINRRVEAQWENTRARTYRLGYNCLNGVNSSEKHSENAVSVIISNDGFEPYTLCRFCVQALDIAGSVYSERVCNTTRLLEEKPARAPTITCDSDTCPFTSDGQTRNVTITCEFPPEESRNGVLTKLKVKYWNETSQEGAYEERFQTNLNSCSIVLVGLSKKHTYFAQLVVCNTEGCSDISDRIKINALNHESKPSDSLSLELLALLVVPLVAVGVVLLIVYVFRRRAKNATRKLATLPDVEEPHSYEQLKTGQVRHDSDSYDELEENANLTDKHQDQPSEVKHCENLRQISKDSTNT